MEVLTAFSLVSTSYFEQVSTPYIWVRGIIVHTYTDKQTSPTDCSIWTTDVVSNNSKKTTSKSKRQNHTHVIRLSPFHIQLRRTLQVVLSCRKTVGYIQASL